MSGVLCPCQYKWPMDALGYKRDPINCEKAWLDFAVRLLSREAVGKGKGQETVWGEKCKPTWWDSTVTHPWKNPTANPKDTKEVLLEKYKALESRLRAELRFPVELEEESCLWRAGKYRELFLLTSLTSLLGKVTSVHSAVEDASVKVNEMKAMVNQSVLSNIQNCLRASLQSVEQLSGKANTMNKKFDVKENSRKRNLISSSKENAEYPPLKQRKLGSDKPEHHGKEYAPSVSTSVPVTSNLVVNPAVQPVDILSLAHKLITKRKSNPHSLKPSLSKNKISTSTQKLILPKPVTKEPKKCAASHAVPFKNVSVSTVSVTPQQLSYLLSQNTNTGLTVMNQDKAAPILSPSPIYDKTPTPLVTTPQTLSALSEDFVFENLDEEQAFDVSDLEVTMGNSSSSTDMFLVSPATDEDQVENSPPMKSRLVTQQTVQIERPVDDPNMSLPLSFTEVLDPNFLNNVEDIEKLCDEILNGSQSSTKIDSMHSLDTDNNVGNALNSFLTPDNDTLSKPCYPGEEAPKLYLQSIPADIALGALNSMTTTCFEQATRACDTGKIESRTASLSSDIGYCSEGSPLSNDLIQEDKEQCPLWPEDASFLLQKFLFDTDDL